MSELDRSVDFYRSIVEATVLTRDDRVAILAVNDEPPRQVLALRGATVRDPVHPGAGSLGVRYLVFETSSLVALDGAARQLAERGTFITERSGEGWVAVVGHDPDRNCIGVSANPNGGPMSGESWAHLDDFLYSVAP